MTTRSSRTSSSTRSVPSASADMRRAIVYHATSITVLWVVVIAMSIGTWLTLLVAMVRLDAMRVQIDSLDQRLQAATTKMMLGEEMQKLVLPTGAPSTPTTSSAPVVPSTTSGLLVRGSLSPDGTRYAGYDDTTKSKIGVETLADHKVRHVVIFNTNIESSGKGTPQEATMSVRWKDNSTVEYDLLVKQGSEWVKETQTVKIFF